MLWTVFSTVRTALYSVVFNSMQLCPLQGTIKAQGCGQGGAHLGDQTVQVGLSGIASSFGESVQGDVIHGIASEYQR